jgi:hypothetical protein
MDATVFYAWQADRSAKSNRYLIRDAANSACERITGDNSTPWSLTLDSDTQGVAGMCDIPNTILEKIRQCDIFLADLSFVGSTESPSGDAKQLPNPNVVFELGYAAKCHGFDTLVGVVNEAFGEVTGQVFDIKRRASLTYCVSEDASTHIRNRERDELSRKLEAVFRTTLDTITAARRKESAQEADDVLRRLRVDCGERILNGEFHGFRFTPATLVSIRTRAAQRRDFDEIFALLREKGVNPRAFAGSYRSCQSAK